MTDFVLIHSATCPHCTAMMGEWRKMEEEFRKNEDKKSIKIHTIEASDSEKQRKIEELNNKIKGLDKIQELGYPTILAISKGVIHKYEKERNALEMAKWVEDIEKRQKGGKKTKKSKTKKSKKTKKNKSRKN
jgi:thiol-disulfide isomerase/thioredoxin